LLGVLRTKVTGSTTWTYTIIMNKQYTFASTQPTISSSTGITGGGLGNWPTDVSGYRVMYASSTGVFNGADLSNQGTIVGGQVPSMYVDALYGQVGATTATGANPVSAVGISTGSPWLQSLVRSPAPSYDSIMQVCPRAEMTRAKEGWYLPLRLTNISANTPFEDPNQLIAIMDDPWLNGSGSNLQLQSGWGPIPRPGNAQFGVVAWKGLAPSSTFAITSRVGYEVTISASTSFRSFVTTSCPPDFALIQEYSRINASIGDIYPSKYNSYDILGKIITQLASHMPPPWNTIVPLLGRVAGGIVGKATGTGKGRKKPAPAPSRGKPMNGGGRRYPGGMTIEEVDSHALAKPRRAPAPKPKPRRR
jgi:hypothetical protein